MPLTRKTPHGQDQPWKEKDQSKPYLISKHCLECTILIITYRYSDYRDTVLSLMADVSRLKFQGVIPGAPIGLNLNIEQPSIKNCSEELKSKKETEKVLVTSL